MAERAIFLIEGGRALDLVKAHIAEAERVRLANVALCEELGVDRGQRNADTGVLTAVVFPGQVHPDFKQPNRHGASYPKKGSDWAKRLAALKGYRPASEVIAEAFSVPLVLKYDGAGSFGGRVIGGLSPCGFAYLSVDGPYGMWLPDVPAEVAETEAEGWAVDPAIKAFRMEFDGCRRILHEEWEVLVAQHRLAKAQRKAEKAAA